MNILVIHNYYRQPGGEKAAVEAQVSLLRSHGHQVILYTRDNKEIDSYGWWRKTAFFWKALFSRQTVHDIENILCTERPDVAHVHNVFPLISPSVYHALSNHGVPIVQTLHNFRFLCPNGLFFTHGAICMRCRYGCTGHAVRLRCYRNSYLLSALYAMVIGLHRRLGTFSKIDRFIALNTFARDVFIESMLAPADKVSICPHFYECPQGGSPLESKEEEDILFLGRISQEKGLYTLIKAMEGLPEFNLVIAGDGDLRPDLERHVCDRRMRNVRFTGWVEGSKKDQILEAAGLIVLPSECHELFGLALAEGMCRRKPVIATRVGGIPDVLGEGKYGVLVNPGDAMALREAIQSLMADPSKRRRLGERGKASIDARYTRQAHYEALLSIYQEETAS